MKKILALLSTVLLLTTLSQAQKRDENEEKKKGLQREKLFIGGNFGLSFGNYTFINVSPQLGYRFTDFFAAGIGVNAQYIRFKERDDWGAYKRKEGVLGLNIFGRAYPVKNIMIQAQPEINYRFGKVIYEGTSEQETNSDAVIVPSLLLGGGLVIPSGRGATIISVSYDVLQDEKSPYGKRPIYNIGYNIGF